MGRGFVVADALVAVGADFKNFEQDVDKQATQTKGKLGRLGAAIKSDLGLTVGAAAGTLAAMGLKVGETWDGAFDTLRTSTGKTGAALEALQGDLRGMAGTVEDSIGTQAEVLAALSKRTGLTGQALQDLAKTELDLARITKTDVNRNVELSTRLFGDWSVAAEDQAATLDKVYRASTNTGIGVDELMEKVVQFGSPLRLLGFGFEESIALLSKWEKEGVNTETALTGLKYSVKTLAAAGVPASEMAETLQERIAAIKTSADPVGDAIKLFGLRAGPDLASAIIEGRFETEELLAVIEGGGDTIAQATEDTEDFGSAWSKTMNTASAAIGPFLAGAGDLASTIGPLIYTLPVLGGAIGKFAGRLGTKGIRGFAGALETLYLKGLMLGDAFSSSRFGGALSDGLSSALGKLGSSPRVTGALDALGKLMGTKVGLAISAAATAALIAAPIVITAAVIEWDKGEDAKYQGELADAVAAVIQGGNEEAIRAAKADLESRLPVLRDAVTSIFTFDKEKAAGELAGVEQLLGDLGDALAGGLAAGAPAVADGAAEMYGPVITEADKAAAAAARSGEAIPKAIGEGILSRQALVTDAMDRLKYLMDNILTRRQEAARAAGLLTSKRLADGLRDGRPAVRAQARAVQEQAEADLARLIAGGGKAGKAAGRELAEMLESKRPAVRRSAQRVKDAAVDILEKTKGSAGDAGEAAGEAFGSRLRSAVLTSDFKVRGTLGINLTARRAGGPVAAGVPYWVNEDTPRSELFVPGQAGQILTHADAMDAARGAAHGSGALQPAPITVNVYNPTPEPASTSTRRELRKLALSGSAM